jgi:hypothetical protein
MFMEKEKFKRVLKDTWDLWTDEHMTMVDAMCVITALWVLVADIMKLSDEKSIELLVKGVQTYQGKELN